MGAFGLLGELGAAGLNGLEGLFGMGQGQPQPQPQPQAPDGSATPQSSDQGALWNTLTNNGQWAQPQPVSAGATTPQAPHEGLLSKAGHLLFGGGQGNPNDPLGRFRPGLVQEALGTAMLGGNPWAARDMLTRRNIAQAMLPYEMQNQALDAANKRAIGEQLYARLHPSSANLQPAGGQQGGATFQPAVMAGGGGQSGAMAQAPAGVGGQAPASGMPVDRDTLALMALGGDKNAAAAWQIGAPKWAIDRGTHQMYDETTGNLGRRLSNKEYVNNYLTDPNDPNAPTYIPKLPEGTMPDGKGGVIPIPGYAAATAQAAGAVAGAQESAKAPYDTVVVQTPQGPVTMTKAQLAAMQGGGSVPSAQGAGPAPAPASGTAPAPQGSSRSVTPQQAMQFYISKGRTPEQAAGIVGNLIGESGLDAGRTADDGSFGLAQWTGPRLQGLFAFAKANKLDPSDPNTQLEYSHFEMTHGEKAAGDAIGRAGNVDDATAAAAGYERPAGYTPQNPQGALGFSQRLGSARQLVTGSGGATAQPAPTNKPFIAQGTNPSTQSTDQDELKTLRAKVEENRYIASKANEFIQKQGNLATGPGYGIGIGPVNVKSISEVVPGGHGVQLQDLDAITNQAWVHLRPQGSGALRGPEIDSFKEAFPNTENLGQANVNIANRLNSELTQSEHELAFKESYLQKNGTLNGADAAWAKQPEARNATVGAQGQGQGQPQPRQSPKLPPRAPSLPGRQPPVQAVRDLKSDPSPQAQKEFDQVFGIGAAKRALGAA